MILKRHFEGEHINTIWIDLLHELLSRGRPVAPRGFGIKEIDGVQLRLVNPLGNVLHHTGRGISYRFMVAEWLWMYFGHDDVKTIAQYNPQIAKFSDNGIDFNGAYGVPLVAQWDRVRDLLRRDPDTRQAIIQIYKPPTRPTKDVPCTINMQFLLRDGKLETIANMRSSDVWLGLPYDVYNFTMLGQCMAVDVDAAPGSLTMHLGSSHLYDTDTERAMGCFLNAALVHTCLSPRLNCLPPTELEDELMNPGTTDPYSFELPWMHYRDVLVGTREEAFKILKRAGDVR